MKQAGKRADEEGRYRGQDGSRRLEEENVHLTNLYKSPSM